MKRLKRAIAIFLAGIIAASAIPLASSADRGGVIGGGPGPEGAYPVAKKFATGNDGSYIVSANGEYCLAGDDIYHESGSFVSRYEGDGMILSLGKTDYFVYNEDETTTAYSIKTGEVIGVYDTVVNYADVFVGYEGETAYYHGTKGRVSLGEVEASYLGEGFVASIDWAGQNDALGEEALPEDTTELASAIMDALSKIDMDLVTAKIINAVTGESITLDKTVIPSSYDPETESIMCFSLNTKDFAKSEIISVDTDGKLLFEGKYAIVGRLDANRLSAVSSDMRRSCIIDDEGKVIESFDNTANGFFDVILGLLGSGDFTLTIPGALCGDILLLEIISTEFGISYSLYDLNAKEEIGTYLLAGFVTKNCIQLINSDGKSFILFADGEVSESKYAEYAVNPGLEESTSVVAYDEEFNFVSLLDENLEEIVLPWNFDEIEAFDEFFVGFNYTWNGDAITDVDAKLVTADGRVLIEDSYIYGLPAGEFDSGKKVFRMSMGNSIADYYFIEYSSMPYVDVAPSDWHYEYVENAVEAGIMIGMSDYVFEPNTMMTRAQLVTILWRMDGSPMTSAAADFSDVAQGDWFAAPVAWAAENRVVMGYDTGEFRPNDSLTREQLAAIIYRYTEMKGKDVSERGDMSSFKNEVDNISDWALESVEWAVGTGLLSGKKAGDDVCLEPLSPTTRAEVATIVKRYRER